MDPPSLQTLKDPILLRPRVSFRVSKPKTWPSRWISSLIGCQVDIIINCAAISQPGVVEKDEIHARAINVPHAILNSALRASEAQPLLIHLSTDQGDCVTPLDASL
jgi:hypothetical protein